MKKGLIFLLVFQFFIFNAFASKAGTNLKATNPTKLALPDKGQKLAVSASNDLLQFRSGGLILGFKPDRVYMAGMGYLLTEKFIDAKSVTPVSAGSEGQKDNLIKGAPELIKVSYQNLWPGITVNYEARQGGVAESTYIIEPLADVSGIRLKYNGEVKIQKNGSLRFKHPTDGSTTLTTGKGYFTMSAPAAWQEIGGKKIKVEVAFNEYQDNTIGFKVGKYDKQYPLIIDPTYQWHTFHGFSGSDYGYGIAVDGSGNVYVTGVSAATWGTPVNPHSGLSDIVVLKLNSSGVLQWNTFHGSGPYDTDYGYGIAVDVSGNVYVTGFSEATWGTPVNPYNGVGTDIVVLKLNSSGVLQWNTFHGSNYDDYGYGIAVDVSGNVYVTGYSEGSWGTPVNPYNGGGNDIVVLKLNSSGVLQWNTFHGSGSYDYGYGIAVDGSGNIYVAGYSLSTWGSPVNASPYGHDIVILKLNSSGVLQWHTFHGSNYRDEGYGIAVDTAGNVYVTGYSLSTWGSPVNPHSGGWGGDIAVLKLNSFGVLQWNTFRSTSVDTADAYGYGIAVDTAGNVYVSGWGWPTNSYSGIIALKLNSSGVSQWWRTFGQDIGVSEAINGIAVDGIGNVYVTGRSYATWGSPVNAYSGSGDIVALKLIPYNTITVTKAGTGSGTVTSSPAGIDCGLDCVEVYNEGTIVTLTATPDSGSTFAGWSGDADCSDGSVTMNANKSCTATFNTTSSTYTLTVTKTGTGNGTVTSSPAGINCGTDCSQAYTSGTSVTLTATPASGSTFAGWSGDADCSDSSVTMNANKSCTATFNTSSGTNTLTVTKSGTGTGTVTSSPAGINCGTDCYENYATNTIVTLTATPDTGSTFAGWSGDADCSDGIVTMDANKTCTATFNSAGGGSGGDSGGGGGCGFIKDSGSKNKDNNSLMLSFILMLFLSLLGISLARRVMRN